MIFIRLRKFSSISNLLSVFVFKIMNGFLILSGAFSSFMEWFFFGGDFPLPVALGSVWRHFRRHDCARAMRCQTPYDAQDASPHKD